MTRKIRLKTKGVYLRIHPTALNNLTPERATRLCRHIGPYELISQLSGVTFNYSICRQLAQRPDRLAELLKRIIYAILNSGVMPSDEKSLSALRAWARYFETLSEPQQ